jgi:HAE1 family hydrophobic/amphiphilic exporter-1
MSSFFIKHPTIAIVISIVMILLGGLSLMGLPIEQYPNIVPPTIKMQATYPGANAETVANSVASPIEQSISGVVGMDYMTSTNANNGICSLSIVFEVGTDPNMDQTLAYMRYGQATAQIPAEVSQMGITITQSTGSPLAVINLYSPDDSLNAIFLSNYAYVSLVDPVKRVPGVGDVQVFGAGRYAMRIWLDTTKMAAQNISVGEVQSAIQAQNTVIPGGQIGAEPAPPGTEFTYSIQTKGRLQTAEEFGNIIIRAEGNKLLYLKDIAKVELGSQTYNVSSKYNGRDSGAIAVYAAPGSNAINTVDALVKLFEDRSRSFPAGMEYNLTLDTTLAVRASIEEIEHTLVEALLLVVLVVFVFLQGWRATLIPAIAVPVSIIATFALFPLLGFTLNTICLMGMVLAIGLVVDDAIVVVEAVESHMERGLTPRQAAFAAMEEVSGPVIAIALVLAAVFLPSLLLPGITGTLFQQFAVTIAISMLISAFNALTLSPALCALLLKPRNAGRKSLFSPFHRLFNWCYGRVSNGYTRMCGSLARKLAISIPLLLLFWGAVAPVAERVPGGFLPDEDQGFLLACLILKPNTSLQVAYEQDKKFEAVLQDPAVKNLTTVVGLNILNSVQTPGACIAYIELKDWSERPETSAELAGKLQGKLAQAGLDGMAMVLEPPAIPGVGTANGVTMVLEDLEGQGVAYLHEQVQRFQEAASRRPEIALCIDMMMADMPQKYVNLDKEKCKFHKVDIDVANGILASYNGSSFINYFNAFGQQWQVYIQAQGEDRASLEKMDGFFVTNADGARVPLSALVNIREIEDTEFVMHHNIYNAAKLNVMPRPGHSTQQVMDALKEVFHQTMDPTKVGFDYQDMSFQENKVRNSIGLGAIFTMSAVFAFLILVALYEKWSLPLAVFLTVPIAVLGAYAGLFWQGMELTL